MKIGPIDTVTILTHDLSKSAAMYISAFGWQVKDSEEQLSADDANRWQAVSLTGAKVLEVCGINGGITNGNELVFRIAVKPPSSIGITQQTINMRTGTMDSLEVRGRHDACIALRVPVVAEAIAAIALADMIALYKATRL